MKYADENIIVEDEIDAPSQTTINIDRTANSRWETDAIRDRITNRLARAYGLIQ